MARLEDVSIDALRAEAQRLGIPTDGQEKSALIASLRPKLLSETRATRKRDKTFRVAICSLVLSIVSLVFAGVAVWQEKRQADAGERQAEVAIQSLAQELRSRSAESKRLATEEWQASEVYRIIDTAFGDKNFQSGVSFGEIKTKYLEAANSADVDLSKNELQESTLNRILYNLVRANAIFKTHDNKFCAQRTELQFMFGRGATQDSASLYIISVLVNEKGKHTIDTVRPMVMDRFKLSQDEYLYVVTGLIKEKWISVEPDGKLYCAAVPAQ